MERWKWTAIILCAFGLFREFRPSEPFFVDYAMDFRNFTYKELVQDILPSTTIASFGSLLVFLCITDSLRYTSVIIFGALLFIASWAITIWWYTKYSHAIIRQVVNAVAVSSELGYFTYMYANVEKSRYKMVTSYTHSALHAGKFLAGLVGQILFSTQVLNLDQLNYISFGGVALSFLMSLLLPKVKDHVCLTQSRSISASESTSTISSFSTNSTKLSIDVSINDNDPALLSGAIVQKSSENNCTHKKSILGRLSIFLPALWSEIKRTYSNRYILKWSVWWAVSMAVYLQVELYAEPLWRRIEETTHQNVYNGAVHASQGLFSAVLGIGIALIKSPWFKYGEIYLSVISLTQGAILIVMSQTLDLNIAYVCYITFETLFEVMIIIVTAEVAAGVHEDSETFIFGLNTSFAFGIQFILAYTVASRFGFALDIRDSFVVYGIYSGIIGLVFLLIAFQNRTKLWEIGKTHTIAHQDNEKVHKKDFTGDQVDGLYIEYL